MLTIHLLTKNNQATIRTTLESLASIESQIMVGDFGSNDQTKKICLEFGAQVYDLIGHQRHVARNKLLSLSSTSQHFWIEPWEAVIKGHAELSKFDSKAGYVTILQDKILTHEVRLLNNTCKFINPVFEKVDVEHADESTALLSCLGSIDTNDAIIALDHWKIEDPFKPDPYHYHACLLLKESKYDEFITMAERYLFMDKSRSMASIMMRYYYAMVQLLHKHKFKPALQNLNLCLCEKPLMAEFWCLTGDVYYHLLHKFQEAREFYENAILLGSRRLREDKWPMDISKYKSYPNKMIESCNNILNHKDLFIQINR